MPCQGPAYVQHSQAAKKAVNFERGAAQSIRLVKRFVDDYLHVRSHPQIT